MWYMKEWVLGERIYLIMDIISIFIYELINVKFYNGLYVIIGNYYVVFFFVYVLYWI